MNETSTATGLPENLAGALSYLLGPVTGIAFLILERHNRFVRFHAGQSVLLTILMIAISFGVSIVTTVLSIMPILGPFLSLAVSLLFGAAAFAFWLFLMFRAFNGDEWEFPWVGEQARRLFVAMQAAD
jgi:uncharacterized membrane protein